MDIKNNTTISSAASKEIYTARTMAKEETLATGQKIKAEQEDNDAVALKITAQPGEPSEIAWENILSASSSITDVSKAEEMVREANRRILENADDAVLAQASQTAQITAELLR